MINKNVLVLAPHTDDGELGAGATINKFIDSGCQVDYVAFSACEESLPNGFDKDTLRKEVINATQHLGITNVEVLNYKVRYFSDNRQAILEDLIKIRNRKKYDLVLLPSTRDVHQDHKTISEEGIRAFKGATIWGYELIWNNLTSSSTCFVKLSKKNVEQKVLALSEYKSQAGRSYVSEEFITSLAKVRGVQIGTEFAECFEVIRHLVE
jgi:LmbE family N-acetylglucosaminyl deacetylase